MQILSTCISLGVTGSESVKRKIDLTIADFRLLHSRSHNKVISAANLSYPSTEQVLNKINYIQKKKYFFDNEQYVRLEFITCLRPLLYI